MRLTQQSDLESRTKNRQLEEAIAQEKRTRCDSETALAASLTEVKQRLEYVYFENLCSFFLLLDDDLNIACTVLVVLDCLRMLNLTKQAITFEVFLLRSFFS